MKVQNNSEIVGVLRNVKRKNEKIFLTFEICKVIEIPFSSDFNKDIYSFIGKKIGILHLEGGVIKVRVI